MLAKREFRLLVAVLERGAQDVAERRTGIGGAVLRDGFLLFGDFERLDRHLDLAGLLVELDHAGIDLLADGKAFGALVVAVTGELRALDEGREVGTGDLHLDAALLHFEHFAGHDRTLLDIARLGEWVAFELLDAKRDALLLDVHIEHHGFHHVALLVVVDHLLARKLPVEVGEMDHAVDVAFETQEQTELGLDLDLALDGRTGRVTFDEDLPGVAHGLLETERDAALDGIDFQHLHFDFLRGRHDLAGVHVLLGPRHLGDVDQAFDARLELDERAVVGDVGDTAGEAGTQRVLGFDALPRIIQELLHAQRDAVRLVVDLDDLDLHGLADREHLGRVVDAAPRDVGDVQQAVDAAEVNERTVIGDVLDHAVDDLTLFEVLHQFLTLLGAGLFQHGAAGDDDVATAAVHLEDLERLRVVHQRRNVADRTDVDLRARQERHGTVEVDGEAALDLVEDDASDLFVVLERLLKLAPALFAAGLVTRQHGFAECVLDAIEEHFHLVADLDLAVTARAGKFAQRDAALGLQANVDDGHVLFNCNHLALDDGALLQAATCEGLVEHRGEIIARGAIGISRNRSHLFSSCGCLAGRWVHGRIGRAVSEGPQNLRATARCSGLRRNSGSGPAEARTFDTWKSLSGAWIAPVPKRRDRRYRPQRAGAGASSNDDRGLTPRTARSDGLDNVDGGPDAAFYIQLGVIEQVSIRCRFQGRNGPILVAFVPFKDVRQYRGLVGILTPRPRLQGPAAGADFRVGDHEDLHVGMRADHGSNIATVEHRARRIGGELTLKIQQNLPHFGDCRNHRSGVADLLGLQGRISELFGIEL